jgi:radical SAM protein with 4Fe4S-binding SPASM domain
MIEPTDVCNLKCPLCPTGSDTLQRAKGFMSLDMYKRIIDQIKPYSYINVLWNQGESFLNPHFVEMISYSSQMGLYTMASTNANMNMDHEGIVRSGLCRLIVSIDGATQETYNKYRINGNLEKVLENVRSLVEAKKRLKSDTPVIELQFLVMKHNEHEIEAIRRLTADLMVDQLRLKTVQIYSKEDVYTYLPDNPKYRRYKIKGDDFELKFGIKNRCRRIWLDPVINWNGDMAVCCFDKEGSIKLGNIMDSSFKELWKGRKFMAFRKAILTNRKQFDICRNCGEGVKLNIEEKNN